jgi:SAM-dependent methyltransferase
MICRTCKGGNLYQFLDLGFTPPADQFRRKDQLKEPVVYYPLEVYMCEDCGLAQLSYVVSPEVLYRNDYPYESSTTMTGRKHWSEFAMWVTKHLGLGANDLVVDIGSNVGTLLEAFASQGVRVQGVDPAANIVRIAEKRGIETICEFFNMDTARKIVDEKGKAAVITATNVFAHVDNLDSFVKTVDFLLKESGVFILEVPYFANLIKNLEYDTIYHEHLSYLSVKPLIHFFKKFGMEVFDIQQVDIHGGSMRVFVARESTRKISNVVPHLLAEERKTQLHSAETLRNFSTQVQKNREELDWLLKSLKHDGKRIVGVSAPAKGMTLLNYCKIGKETLDFITEKSTLKIGRYTPGAHIPVVPDVELVKEVPDYALLLAWNFADEIMENLNVYRKAGGKFIIPIPTPRIVE